MLEAMEPSCLERQESEEREDREMTQSIRITQSFLAGKLSFTEYTDQMDHVFADLSETVETYPYLSIRRQARRQSNLPVGLKGLVGEANVHFARGDHVVAEKMCLEVIRQVPTAPEPYFTLAQIYEQTDPEKSLKFDLIAAHLNPYNEDQWLKVGSISENLGYVKQADTCYSKAILANITNISSHMKRINFLESLGEVKLANKAKYRALNYMTEQHIDLMISMVKELAKIYIDEGDIRKAKDCLNFVFYKVPSQVTPELANIQLELLLQLKKYNKCLEILIHHCNIDVEVKTEVYETSIGELEEKLNIISYQLPETIQIDLHIKFICCLIHLKSFDLIEPLLGPLLANEKDVEQNGYLYLDVTEALMDEEQYCDALKFLISLVKIKNFGLSAVWLRQAECLTKCDIYEQVVDSFKMVMKLESGDSEVKYLLCDILIKLDRKTEATAVSEQDENNEAIDAGLLFKNCYLQEEFKIWPKLCKLLIIIKRLVKDKKSLRNEWYYNLLNCNVY